MRWNIRLSQIPKQWSPINQTVSHWKRSGITKLREADVIKITFESGASIIFPFRQLFDTHLRAAESILI